MILAILAAVTATFQPPAPKVGDLVTVQFTAPLKLDASEQYEIVSQSGNRAVVRTFSPVPFALSGTVGGVRFQNLRVPVQSVLAANDDLRPAPLVPPRSMPYPRAPFIAIGTAALCALLAWMALWLRSRKRVEAPMPALSADERFRRAVLALRHDSSRARRWAELADETRAYLAATRSLGSELTTTEVLPRLAEQDRVVEEILRQGDLEKFSPRGQASGDFDEVVDRALRMAS